MSRITLHEGDNRVTLRRLIDQGVRVHSVCCDPPYGLVSVTKRFGKDGAAPAKFGKDGAFQRQSAGFMNSLWDGTGIERDPEFWALIWEILLPGGYCIAFSGSRTGHWQACAMEMAGFVMHPMTGWVFGQGFPKDHDAAKAIDRELGAERERIAATQHPGWQRDAGNSRPYMSNPDHMTVSDEPATAAAAAWEGWAYGTQSLKPALEPIYIGQKPFSEKNGALNLLKHGVGAVNIDACRVGGNETTVRSNKAEMGYQGGNLAESYQTGSNIGRHPANLLHDGSPDVVALFPATAGQLAPVSTKAGSKTTHVYGNMSREGEASADRRYGDQGATDFAATPGMRREPVSSAARFFNAFPPDADPIYYHGKATVKDRITQCTACGVHAVGSKPDCGCVDLITGSKAPTRAHPTVKPIGLMEHLVKLVTPPGGVVLDPFAGTGTTGAAARNLGFDCILMEADPDYANDIRARLALPAPVTGLPDELTALLDGTPNIMDLVG